MPENKKIARPSAILWDLDGTLIDQTAPIIRCYTEVITSLGYPKPDRNIIKRSLGGPLSSTMQLFVDTKDIKVACTSFRSNFPKIMFDGIILMSGAIKCIESAYKAQIPQAIFTNKDGNTAREVSRFAGFSNYIPICVGSSDTIWNKPNTKLTEHVLGLLKVSKKDTLIIGDSPTDIDVAKKAGLNCYCVATGAHSEIELNDAGAVTTFDNLSSLYESLIRPLICSIEPN